jgi:acyl-[acyl-carrier-protein]-phospholipid O-acyltransferase/long-chain-fatty-acid--[acyl-carrier-protein] ligase
VTAPEYGLWIAVVTILSIALMAWFFTFLTPNTLAAAPSHQLNWHIGKDIVDLMRWGMADKTRVQLLLGHAWFWFVGAGALSQLTILVREQLNGAPEINTFFLALFAAGIGLGSWLCTHVMKGNIHAKHTACALVGMGLAAISLSILMSWYVRPMATMGLNGFLSDSSAPLIIVSLIALAACAGFYVVPLVTLLQICVPAPQRARLLALANIFFAIFVMLSSLILAIVLAMGGNGGDNFAILGILSLIFAAYFKKNPIINKHYQVS